ncbi:Flagellar protein flgA precursor [Liberibacter crescens BT-1]|uniref:Flagella basal body P-ring formation protein FlgA n=2 Tax=Liberibacter crescens TaxID=1273132 RepID=L0ETN4_LIBCB|nr:Flagellar protein flgA precursor [Liberibacter crescens BT-1]AMC13304.1 flagellar basal body P-ring biosynthesis protein FlgA [Liberibacter crescens]
MFGLSNASFAFATGVENAVVPSVVIYPGEILEVSKLKEIKITNSNIKDDYARSIKEVIGLASKRTLLPNLMIPRSALRRSYVIKRGSNIRLVFIQGSMMISASGISLTDASVGDVIRVRNSDTGIIISGTVMIDGTVHVLEK